MTSRHQLFTNNATTTLASGITPYDTTIVLKDGSSFPNPGANQFFVATIDNGVAIEVIEVTSRQGNALVGVIRAREFTNAAYFSEGSKIEVRVTAGYLDTVEGLKTQIDNLAYNIPSLENISRIVFSDIPGDRTPRGMNWNIDEQTADLTLGGTGVTLQIGQETLYRVKNNSGQTIPNGTVVMSVGTVGNSGRILIAPGIATGLYEGKHFLGIVTETITNGSDGFVTHFGKVRGIPTNGASVGEAWADGDVLYANPEVPGGLTKVKPTVPNEIITIAIVISAHATNGTLFVRPTIDSHRADVARYHPASGPDISVQDALSELQFRSGLKGGGSDRVFYENDAVVNTSYSITAGKNAMTAGPVTIGSGATVTVPSGSTWTIV